MRSGANKVDDQDLVTRFEVRPSAARRAGSQRRFAERGQSMVEMAFLLLYLLIFIFAVIEIGRAWAAKQAITNAAREGARILVLPYCPDRSCRNVTPDDVCNAARQTTMQYLDTAGLSTDQSIAKITFIPNNRCPSGVRGEQVGIMIEYQFSTPLPVLLFNSSSPVIIRASSIMEHE